ncbi:molybdopterin oxidoreductase [Desulfovibrio sp. X2]|uniref:molybdopterin-dependent oxidoreductase n=1 Tax=Desulfovibrio sp. X2 TaxID=941449 RepID=UPI0003589438|nr:molybdopterin-dependent oxidoreductase [Desulfovibrio sp. X2]EPR43627.1 molybdopterin oxidoreductase [Desulfovibrio sp. X2]
MAKQKVFSVCGMCTVRCPIEVDVADNEVLFIQGNSKSGLKGALCARGAAGYALTQDDERPQYPMIREGERGEGRWRRVSWDEAFAYVAEKLTAIQEKHGKESVIFSDRGGPFVDLHQAFVRGLGSPNYHNHDSACARGVQHAAKSVLGMGRKDVVYDFKNAKHIVLQTRNIFEAINVSEVNSVLDALDAGCKLTVIDVRATVSAGKADNFFMIRPGTDYAFNLGVIHALIHSGKYDKEYVSKYVNGFDALRTFIGPYTPKWAAEECGVSAKAIEDFAAQLAEAAPSVIWHPGWMTARYKDSFFVSRTAYIINALLGAIGAKGGLPVSNKPGDVGAKGIKKFVDLFPKPEAKRADGAGWKYPHIDAGPGLVNLAYDAAVSGDPYPVRAYICHRHDPLMAYPDPDALKKKWENLDLLVSVTFSWSDTAWHSDVVLPMSPYLERESPIAQKGGLKPQFFVRQRALQPRYDTKADWEILTGIAKAMGVKELAFENAEAMWNYQLEGTGKTVADFAEKGFVELCAKPLYKDMTEFKFPTPSGKIEIIHPKWEDQGMSCLRPYESPAKPPAGSFRIIFGRCGLHTQGHTVNNKLLNEQMPENVLWLNDKVAAEMGVSSGDKVKIGGGSESGVMKAFVTEYVHPEAAFMIHGFGHKLPPESRAYGKGVADNALMPGGLENWSKEGGYICMQEHFVTVSKA